MRIFQFIFSVLSFHRRNWKAVALCIFAATVFWLFNALNKNYTTNVNLPLVFDYDRESYIAVRPLPEHVRFNVTGLGWNLFRRSVGIKVLPLVVPLSNPGEVKKIVGSTLPALVTNQPEGFDINFVLTDTLHLSLEPKSSKWVKILVDTPTLLFREGYGLVSDVQVEPDSIFIEGPANLLKSLPSYLDLKLSQRNIDEDFSEEVEVKFLNDALIKRDPPTVSVAFEVDNFVEITDLVSLEIVNPPKDSWPVIGEKKLAITFAVPDDDQNSFAVDSLKALIDLKNIKKGNNKMLPTVIGLPKYARVVKMDSISIKF